MAFGEAVEPQYHFDKADVVLSLDADFLVRGPGRLRWARDFMDRRRLVAGKTEMNRLYAVESTATVTGIKADHRIALKAGAIEAFARVVAGRLGVAGAGTATLPAPVPEALVAALVHDLEAHRGRALVLAGEEQPAVVHALAHAMNEALGNVGQTVTYTAPVDSAPADQMGGLRALSADMEAGKVDVVVVLGSNPVYSAPPDLRFAERMARVTTRIHLGLFEDETAALCHWHIPEAHFLEAWSDARAFDGTVTICQPLIAPLYDSCRSAHEIVALLAGTPDPRGYDIVREFWSRAFSARAEGAFGAMAKPDGSAFATFDEFWRRAIHDGFIAGSAIGPKAVALRADAVTPASASAPAEGLEITFRPCPSLWDGRFANNGWLMELPRPVTKVSWEHVALVSPRTARRLGVVGGYQVTDLVTLRLNGQGVKMPIWTLPGQPDDSVTVFLGYGRARAGRVGGGVGADVNPLRTSQAAWMATGLEVLTNGERVQVPCTQGHFALEGRNHVRVANLGHYVEDPEFAHHLGHTPEAGMTLHGNEWKYESYAWGLSVDLNACIGCNACVVACQSENNIPVVGRDQVLRQREMHWIRVDRYYTGEVGSPDTFFQPMMCQQCETAPCEVVCPVAATAHSSEGLNDMVYNRCVGTRYCSNNCPYKVRRFNFFLYADWNTPSLKMARNPDVTVRSRGVMEKCTYCVQRINHARIDAKREDRQIRDGEIVTACEAACPTQAIVFGDINDPEARVARMKKEPRDYGVLAELNTRPRTSYLAAVRNPHPDLAPSALPSAHGPAAGH
jgi:molybdopterin-containing oxidoreductase family iron-sulfur binding subunit